MSRSTWTLGTPIRTRGDMVEHVYSKPPTLGRAGPGAAGGGGVMSIELVRQEHSHECAIACLAMVAGCSLDDARQAYDWVYPGKRDGGRGVNQGLTEVELDVVLAECGYATARLYLGVKSNRRAVWPPEPWSDVHIACVNLVNGGHFVVLLGDGTVLDPMADEPRTLDHPSYMGVQHIAAVVPTGAAPGVVVPRPGDCTCDTAPCRMGCAA